MTQIEEARLLANELLSKSDGSNSTAVDSPIDVPGAHQSRDMDISKEESLKEIDPDILIKATRPPIDA